MEELHEAIEYLIPGAKWYRLMPNKSNKKIIDQINWTDLKGREKPTERQLFDAIEKIKKEKPIKEMRKIRNILLKKSDWIVVKSTEMGEPVPQEWKDYRQALRDLPEKLLRDEQNNIIYPKIPD
jgi:hypothetical protein